GLTAIRALVDAGVTVAGGGDNVQDVFIPMGNADPLATAQYLVVGGQLEPEEAYDLVSVRAREVMGLPAAGIAPGAPADLVAVRGSSLREVVATASEDRIVWRRGRIVARTEIAAWREAADRRRKEVAAP
ncbi:MAG: amidohydrolase family protein, partial [Actinobacteria bacterium]|nr:amidohydrolase family protein [Actinomycetota bacterium]